MCITEEAGRERNRLNFAHLVTQRFGFLSAFGFAVSESLPTIVRYRNGDLELNLYHGRQSFEVGLQVEHGDDCFSMSELIRSSDPAIAEQYRNPMATTPDGLEAALDRLADLLRQYGEPALRNDPQFFSALRKQKTSWAEEYALDVLVEQTRPKADAAFRAGRYQEAADLYGKIAPRLTETEQKKLAAARKRI